ncbi:MAG: ROK family protein [Acidimicrobiia bacterium]|nr:ROK family protein [Acidimicrobiia bacterium]
MYFGIEAGGTKFNCAVGQGTDLVAEARIPTAAPGETLDACVSFFEQARRDHGAPSAIGIATFGPVDLDTGIIGATPKEGWIGANLTEPFGRFECPISLETDVTGAAIGEAMHGAGKGLDPLVYLTVGTGVGGGAIVGGRPLHGDPHPEMGHIPVTRADGDEFEGTCPHHRSCLEGLACGPAISARWGRPSHDLGPSLGPAIALESRYLAQGIAAIVAVLAPRRVILGGGVMEISGMLGATRSALAEVLQGYPGAASHDDLGEFLVPPGLGSRAGIVGALEMAARVG